MKNFKKFRRTQIAEMREVTEKDISTFHEIGELRTLLFNFSESETNTSAKVSISEEDLLNDSPKIGDMIARNPKNHFDQWLVAEQYFKDNFEEFEK